MQRLLGILLVVVVCVVPLLGSAQPAAAADCCAHSAAVYCYACAGVASVLQQQPGADVQQELRYRRIERRLSADYGIEIKIVVYGVYWVNQEPSVQQRFLISEAVSDWR